MYRDVRIGVGHSYFVTGSILVWHCQSLFSVWHPRDLYAELVQWRLERFSCSPFPENMYVRCTKTLKHKNSEVNNNISKEMKFIKLFHRTGVRRGMLLLIRLKHNFILHKLVQSFSIYALRSYKT
jgi:hypothetical protein